MPLLPGPYLSVRVKCSQNRVGRQEVSVSQVFGAALFKPELVPLVGAPLPAGGVLGLGLGSRLPPQSAPQRPDSGADPERRRFRSLHYSPVSQREHNNHSAETLV